MEKLRGPDYKPYFVQCYKTHLTDVALYLVMEFCEDGSLEHHIKEKGHFDYLTGTIVFI
jgi:hypothetical protein